MHRIYIYFLHAIIASVVQRARSVLIASSRTKPAAAAVGAAGTRSLVVVRTHPEQFMAG